MDGVAAVVALLAADAGVTALVPATATPSRIIAGTLPSGVVLPALSVVEISAQERVIPGPSAKRHITARVQVTGAAKSYPQARALMRAVRHACADKMPTIAGISEVTVHADGAGPDIFDESARICFKTQDFLVSYNEPA